MKLGIVVVPVTVIHLLVFGCNIMESTDVWIYQQFISVSERGGHGFPVEPEQQMFLELFLHFWGKILFGDLIL